MKPTLLLLASFTALATAFAQTHRTTPKSSSKKRLTQAEWYRMKAQEDSRRLQEIHDLKYLGRVSPNGRYLASLSDITNNVYELPAVKKLGIKPPPRNRLKQDPYVPAQEQQRAKFLNESELRHRELVSRLVKFIGDFSCPSASSFVSDLNRVATSYAWKRMANSNASPLFAGEEKRFRDEISSGLSSVRSSLNDFEYQATQHSCSDSSVSTPIIITDSSCSSEYVKFLMKHPEARREFEASRKLIRENDPAFFQYKIDHPEDPDGLLFNGRKTIIQPDVEIIDHSLPFGDF